MTSIPAAIQKPETSTDDPRDAAERYLFDLLEASLASHGEETARTGERFAPFISQLRWNSEGRCFTCSLPGGAAGDTVGEPGTNGNAPTPASPTPASSTEIKVEVDLPFAIGDPLRLACDCPARDGGRCEHTWAALKSFVDYLHHYPDDPLVDEVFGLDEAPAWLKTLDTLDGFLGPEKSARKTAGGTQEADAERRLVWRVRVGSDGVETAAWEQRISQQDGEWTAGRRVGWERLRTTPELWTCEADRRAVSAIREQTEIYNDTLAWWQIDPFAALLALVGHPLVFTWDGGDGGDRDGAERRVRVEKAEIGLEVTLAMDGSSSLVLDAALGDEPLRTFPRGRLHEDPEERGLVAFLPGNGDGFDRLLLATADPRVLHFVRTLGGQPRVVPPEGQEELLRRLAQLESWLPVRLPDGLVAETIAPDRRLFLRLTPVGAAGLGLMVQIRTRPAPGSFHCLPGEGPPRLTGLSDGRRVAVIRRPEEERRTATELAERLGLDAFAEERPWQWRIHDDDVALDLIFAAQLEADDDVLVEWPAGGKRVVVGRLGTSQLKIEVADRNDWFSLKGGVEVNGWQLPLLDLLLAMRRGRRYVQLGSEEAWAEITEGFRERLEALEDVIHLNKKRLEVDVTGAPVMRELLDEGQIEASERFELLTRRLAEFDSLDTSVPEGFEAELRGYQHEGYRWMRRLAHWGVGGCLADDMGLGKTVQTLAILLARQDEGPSLVVAPTSLGFNWQREAARFAPTLDVRLFRECDRAALVKEVGPGDIVIVSYGLLVREIERLGKVPWGTLVLDEAQAIKNSRTKTAQAVRKVEAKWALALSGTPIENHLGELWSLFRSISPGLFGTWNRFRDRFAGPIEKEKDTDRRRALSRLVRPFILRRTKMEVLDELPPRTEVDLWVELSDDERQLYEDVRMKAILQIAQLEVEAAEQRFQVLAALTRLRQLACHPQLADPAWSLGSSKLEAFLELVEELRDGGHRALVFSQFTRHLAILRRELEARDVECQYLDGQTPVKARGALVDAFQAGEGEIFLISLMAGGVGLNLTAADYVIHMDPWWNPAIEDQATDRAHRMGQKRPVTVYRLVTKGTIEEEILELHANKRHLMADVLKGTDRAGQLSTDELVSLIRSGGDEAATDEP